MLAGLVREKNTSQIRQTADLQGIPWQNKDMGSYSRLGLGRHLVCTAVHIQHQNPPESVDLFGSLVDE